MFTSLSTIFIIPNLLAPSPHFYTTYSSPLLSSPLLLHLHPQVRLASDQGAPLEGVLVIPRGGETNYWTNEQTRTDL